MELIKDTATVTVGTLAIGLGFLVALKLSGLEKVFDAARERGQKMFSNTNAGRRAAMRVKRREEMKNAKAVDLESRLASGTYRGYNPLLRARSAANRARGAAVGHLSTNAVGRAVASKLGGDYLTENMLFERKRRAKERAEQAGDFNNNTRLARAWVESGGGRDTTVASYQALNGTEQAAFRQLQASGRADSAESIFSGLTKLAQEGEGDAFTLQQGLRYARQLGASEIDVTGLEQEAISTWRSQGRGDLPEVARPGFSSWESITPSMLSRHALATEDQRTSFLRWYKAAGEEQKIAYIAAYTKMNGSTQAFLRQTLENGTSAEGGFGPGAVEYQRHLLHLERPTT